MINIEPIEILQQHDDIFSTTNNFVIYIFRFFWYILSSLQLIVASLESALNEMFKHLDFFNSTKMMSFMQSMKPITSALLVIGILIIGFKLMTNTLREKRGILLNFIFVVIIFSGFQTLLVQFSNFTSTTANAFMDINGSSVSQNIIKNSITDLKYLDENNFSDTSLSNKNNINPQNIMKIDPVELMIPKETNNKAVFENKLVIDTSGNLSTKKLDDGHFLGMGSDMFSSYYYRYKIEWVNLTITLISLGVGLVWSCIKVAELIYQLGITVAITPFVAVLDVSTGQRTKRVLQKILNIFLVIISVAFMYRIFYLGVDFIQSIPNLNIWVETFLIVGFSLGLINGPDIIQELLGIDVGTSASNMFYTTQMVGGAVKTALNTPKNIANAVASVGRTGRSAIKGASAIGGYYTGKTQGLWENYQKSKNNDNDNNIQEDKQDISTAGLFWNNKLNSADKKLLKNKDGSIIPLDDKHLHQEEPNNLQSSNNISNTNDNKQNKLNIDKNNTNDESNQTTPKAQPQSDYNNMNNNIIDNNTKHSTDTTNNPNMQNNSKQDTLNISENDNLSNNDVSYNVDKTTTLKDIAKQKFDNSVFSPKDIINTYNKAKQIGINTANSNIEKRKILRDTLFKNWKNNSNISPNTKSQYNSNINSNSSNYNKETFYKDKNKIFNKKNKTITTKKDRKFIERNDKK